MQFVSLGNLIIWEITLLSLIADAVGRVPRQYHFTLNGFYVNSLRNLPQSSDDLPVTDTHVNSSEADHLICLHWWWRNNWLNVTVNHQTDVVHFGVLAGWEQEWTEAWQHTAGALFLWCLSSARAFLPVGHLDSRFWRTGSMASPNPSWVSALHCTGLPYHCWSPHLKKLPVWVILWSLWLYSSNFLNLH